MGQLFTLAPVPTGFRCDRSDYGAVRASLTGYPVLNPLLLEFSRLLRSFPATFSLGVSTPRKAEGKGGLNNVR